MKFRIASDLLLTVPVCLKKKRRVWQKSTLFISCVRNLTEKLKSIETTETAQGVNLKACCHITQFPAP
jgi:hypothetical protein